MLQQQTHSPYAPLISRALTKFLLLPLLLLKRKAELLMMVWILSSLSSFCPYSIFPSAYEQTQDMNVVVCFIIIHFFAVFLCSNQVFQEVATFHGVMKKMACKIVSRHYADALMNGPGNHCNNQLKKYECVKSNVSALLHEGGFMNGGHDEQVFDHSFIFILS